MREVNPVLVDVAKVLQVDPRELEKEVQKDCEHLSACETGTTCDFCGKSLIEDMAIANKESA